MKTLNARRGQMLIFAMVFMAILLTMSASVVGYVVMHAKAERQTVAGEQALQIAEAGADKAIYQLNQNPNYSGESGTALGGGTFTTTVTTIDANDKKIVSTGNLTSAAGLPVSRTVRITASINNTVIAFQSAVQVGAGGLELDEGSQVNGNVFSNGSISGQGTITGDAYVAAGTVPTADQSWTVQNGDFFFGQTSQRTAAAQSFAPSVAATINKVSVYLKKIGSPGDLTVQIVSDSNGAPSKNVLASGTISASLITASYGFIDGTFSSNPNLNTGQKYWLMLVAPGVSAGDYYSWGIDTNSGYQNNAGDYTVQWNAHNPVWNSAGGDFDFKTYLGGAATSLTGVSVGGNVHATSLNNCAVSGNAYYQTTNGCAVSGTTFPNTAAPAPAAMPISAAQIAGWENAAQVGGIINGGETVPNGGTATLGPVEINGDLTVNNNAIVYLKGPVWVNGNINLNNNARVYVDVSLGGSGTVLIADYVANTAQKGQIVNSNNAVLAGNGNPASYLMVISTYSGQGNASIVNNNAAGVIFYAPNGKITLSNNATANQLTAYAIEVDNNSTINYVNGLQNANFSSGPGGSWNYQPGSYVIVK